MCASNRCVPTQHTLTTFYLTSPVYVQNILFIFHRMFYKQTIRIIILIIRKKEEQILEKTEMRLLRRIKGVTFRGKVKSVNIRKGLGVNSIQEKVR